MWTVSIISQEEAIEISRCFYLLSDYFVSLQFWKKTQYLALAFKRNEAQQWVEIALAGKRFHSPKFCSNLNISDQIKQAVLAETAKWWKQCYFCLSIFWAGTISRRCSTCLPSCFLFCILSFNLKQHRTNLLNDSDLKDDFKRLKGFSCQDAHHWVILLSTANVDRKSKTDPF